MDEYQDVVYIDADYEDLIPQFLENRRKDVAKLRELAAAAAFEEARRIGHSMKGVGGGYGFERISEIGRAIEEAAAQRDGPAVQRLVDQLERYLTSVKIVYQEM